MWGASTPAHRCCSLRRVDRPTRLGRLTTHPIRRQMRMSSHRRRWPPTFRHLRTDRRRNRHATHRRRPHRGRRRIDLTVEDAHTLVLPTRDGTQLSIPFGHSQRTTVSLGPLTKEHAPCAATRHMGQTRRSDAPTSERVHRRSRPSFCAARSVSLQRTCERDLDIERTPSIRETIGGRAVVERVRSRSCHQRNVVVPFSHRRSAGG